MADIPTWHVVGDWFDNCSCAVACPCTFAQPPDNRYGDSVLFWHIQRGYYGDVNLDGLSYVRVGRWEGDLWAGKVLATRARVRYTSPQEDTSHESRPGKAHAQLVPASEPR